LPKLDFSSISGRAVADTAIEPRRIFAALPAKSSKYEYPRDVQSEVWDEWHDRRAESDLVVKMNTGGGKTVVGLVMLKSCLNEGTGPAVYLAPDKYLADQARAEAKQLGIATVNEPRAAGFLNGSAILVTNIYKLVNGRSQFGVQDMTKPIDVGTVLVDDAHACLGTVEEQFTLDIPNSHVAYDALLNLFRSDLKLQSPARLLDIEADDPVAAILLPYWAWQNRQEHVLEILHPHRKDDHLGWVWPLLVDSLSVCEVAVSADRFEIRPPCPPIARIPSFVRARRRIYLTATLADDSVLATHFGADPESVSFPVTPRSADDLGDRMILAPMDNCPEVTAEEIADLLVSLSRTCNVVIICPSRSKADRWRPVADAVHAADTLHGGVSSLRNGHVGLVVLINKYDGIDLPHDACRVLVIDGLPEAYGPLDVLEAASLADTNAMVSRQIQRIEQGMGRGVRSQTDHCVVLMLGSRLTQHLHRQNSLREFSPATRAQLGLSREVATLMSGRPFSELREVIDQCLERDPAWLSASRDALDGVTYDGSSRMSSSAVAGRAAFDQATKGQPGVASATLAAAAGNEDDLRLAGFMKQRAAAYLHAEDPVAAEKLQWSAVSDNDALLRPPSTTSFKRLSAVAAQAEECARVLRSFDSHTELVLATSAILDDLVPSPEPSRVPPFEQALNDLGGLLGFASQRPELALKEGPDVLWCLTGTSFAVIECKSGAETDYISKHDAAQLSHSVDWFKGRYPGSGCTAVPVLIHPSRALHAESAQREGTGIITFDRLSDLRGSVNRFVRSMENVDLKDVSEVGARLNQAHLNAGSFLAKWSQKPQRWRP
jgi:hypothetical protein